MIIHRDENRSVAVCKPSADSVVYQTLRRCNSFFLQGMRSCQGECRPLVVNGRQIGLVRPDVAFYLAGYPDVFSLTPSAIHLNAALNTYESRSDAMAGVLLDLKAKDVFEALRCWRGECFNVWADFGHEPLFQIERAAAALLGIRSYGCFVNGYVKAPDGTTYVWIQKRSVTKPTYPGMMDIMVGGGVTAGLRPSRVAAKEADEEASVPAELMQSAVSAGTVSFIAETARGIHANTEFVYDLELPQSFVPRNKDNEVEGFELITLQELKNRVLSPLFKLTSIPVGVDFLIRHGLINPDTESNLQAITELLHVPLNQFYNHWPLYPPTTFET